MLKFESQNFEHIFVFSDNIDLKCLHYYDNPAQIDKPRFRLDHVIVYGTANIYML